MTETPSTVRTTQWGWVIFGGVIAAIVVLPVALLYWSVRDPTPNRLGMSINDLEPLPHGVVELQRWEGFECPGAGDAIPCAETASMLIDPGQHSVSELARYLEDQLVSQGWEKEPQSYWGSHGFWMESTRTSLDVGSLAAYLEPVLGPSLNQNISDDLLGQYDNPGRLIVLQLTAGPD